MALRPVTQTFGPMGEIVLGLVLPQVAMGHVQRPLGIEARGDHGLKGPTVGVALHVLLPAKHTGHRHVGGQVVQIVVGHLVGEHKGEAII